MIEKISSVTIDDIIVLYEKLLLEYNLDYIDSTTSINWIPALDFLFTRLLNELFSCKKLSSIISEIQYLNAQVANWSQLPSLLKIQKSRIEKILYEILAISYDYVENFVLNINQIYLSIC